MKVNPIPTSEELHENASTTRLSYYSTGTTVGARAVTNYNSKSTAYQQMNALIINLDITFKLLPP